MITSSMRRGIGAEMFRTPEAPPMAKVESEVSKDKKLLYSLSIQLFECKISSQGSQSNVPSTPEIRTLNKRNTRIDIGLSAAQNLWNKAKAETMKYGVALT
jgi:hypothetical protein